MAQRPEVLSLAKDTKLYAKGVIAKANDIKEFRDRDSGEVWKTSQFLVLEPAELYMSATDKPVEHGSQVPVAIANPEKALKVGDTIDCEGAFNTWQKGKYTNWKIEAETWAYINDFPADSKGNEATEVAKDTSRPQAGATLKDNEFIAQNATTAGSNIVVALINQGLITDLHDVPEITEYYIRFLALHSRSLAKEMTDNEVTGEMIHAVMEKLTRSKEMQETVDNVSEVFGVEEQKSEEKGDKK